MTSNPAERRTTGRRPAAPARQDASCFTVSVKIYDGTSAIVGI